MGKILIVDDSRTSRKMLREILEGMGHEIAGEATNGEEGYVMYKELNPDLVTLDITMPKMDGIEALMLIKKYNENAEAVMITAAGQKEKNPNDRTASASVVVIVVGVAASALSCC